MKQIAAQGINPVLLGVPDKWTDTVPTVDKMPSRFNAGNIKVWEDCIKVIDTRLESHEQWSAVIQMYIRICGRKNLDPFTTDLDRADNEAIRAYMKMARLALCRWFDRTRILEQTLMQKVWHTVTIREEQGFVLHAYARTMPLISLPELELFLRRTCKFHIVPGRGGKTWQGYPRPDVMFSCQIINSQHVRLHYAITVTRPIFNERAERGIRMTVNELRDWINKTFWMPVARGFKPRYTSRNTSF